MAGTEIPQGNGGGGSGSSAAPPLNTAQMRSFLISMATKLNERISMDTIRPLPLFLGVTGPSAFCFSATAFTPPTRHLDKTTHEKIFSRLGLNMKFFLSNYAMVTLGVGIVICLLNPAMLFSVASVFGLWRLHELTLNRGDTPLVIFGKDVTQWGFTQSRRSTFLTALTIIVVVSQCLMPVLAVMFVSGTIILTHALLRDPRDVEQSGMFRTDDRDSGEDTEDDDRAVMVERP